MSFLLILLVLLSIVLSFYIYRKNRWYRFDIWIFSWLRYVLKYRRKLPGISNDLRRHIIFSFVDHFEPGTGGAGPKQSLERFNAWVTGYPILANQFRDSLGRPPQHTFFFPPHYFCDDYLKRLAEFDWNGYGEVEFHLHHSGDTSETLRAKIEETLELYSRYGVFLTEGDPVDRCYGFVHGDWALDNSRPEYCGVNDELTILRETGCYADFTFPSLGPAQPSLVNCIYRAKDDPHKPKSYNTGKVVNAEVEGSPSDLMMVTGPIGFRFRKKFPWVSVEDSDVTGEAPGNPQRVRGWVRSGIHIPGRPEWIFVKVHTHGAVERHWNALLGQSAEQMWLTLCEEYNDGKNYELHFVTAREMYNIARAAEMGMSGNPDKWKDFEIRPYLTRSILSNKPYEAKRFTDKCFELYWGENIKKIEVLLKKSFVRVLRGNLISAKLEDNKLLLVGAGQIIVGLIAPCCLQIDNKYLSSEKTEKIDGNEIDIYQYQCGEDGLEVCFTISLQKV